MYIYRAVAEVQKSRVHQWISEVRASSLEDPKYSASKIIADTKSVFTTPQDFVIPSSDSRAVQESARQSWLSQVTQAKKLYTYILTHTPVFYVFFVLLETKENPAPYPKP